jgi:hypothetical protein
MRLPLSLLCLAVLCLAADKKKPVVTTKTKVQVGTPPSTNKSSIGLGGLDRNGDGRISRTEYMYNKPSTASTEFDRLDANKDGYLSRSEYR